MSLNKVILTGRITCDLELKMFGNDGKVVNFSIAVNERNKNKETTASFFNCVSFGSQAETICKYFKNGERINIIGRLKQNTWKDKDGNRRDKIEIVVEQFEFVERKQNNQQSGQQTHQAIYEETPF